jgi:hypothetical protein
MYHHRLSLVQPVSAFGLVLLAAFSHAVLQVGVICVLLLPPLGDDLLLLPNCLPNSQVTPPPPALPSAVLLCL